VNLQFEALPAQALMQIEHVAELLHKIAFLQSVFQFALEPETSFRRK